METLFSTWWTRPAPPATQVTRPASSGNCSMMAQGVGFEPTSPCEQWISNPSPCQAWLPLPGARLDSTGLRSEWKGTVADPPELDIPTSPSPAHPAVPHVDGAA